jgi:hypothetical protein
VDLSSNIWFCLGIEKDGRQEEKPDSTSRDLSVCTTTSSPIAILNNTSNNKKVFAFLLDRFVSFGWFFTVCRFFTAALPAKSNEMKSIQNGIK